MDRNALKSLSYGLYIVSSYKGDKLNGQIVNTAFQTTSRPPTIAVSINKDNLTHECIVASKVFSVSVLSEETGMKTIGTFGFKCGRDIDKFKEFEYRIGITKAPIVLTTALAFIEAEVIHRVDLGTHSLFVGNAVAAEVVGQGTPLTYDYYHRTMGGKTPEKAATFSGSDAKTEGPHGPSSSYVCTVCGYVYNPATGDPGRNITPGVAFADLPQDWTCPVCGAGKENFEKQ